ncbi:MAG TPA: hypothetical protein VF886_00090, partial [Roseiarcus sp.]
CPGETRSAPPFWISLCAALGGEADGLALFVVRSFDCEIDDSLADKRILDADERSIQPQPLVEQRLIAVGSIEIRPLRRIFPPRAA